MKSSFEPTKEQTEAASNLRVAGRDAHNAMEVLERAVTAAHEAGIPSGDVIPLAKGDTRMTAFTLDPLRRMLRNVYMYR